VLIRKLAGNRPLVQHKAAEPTHAGELAGMPAE
jgi:hypothetical protein